jgi:hypothetical protein
VLSKADVSAGLAGPAAMITLMGSSGAYLFIVLVFMAVTSSVSAESIAASSLITFDVYKTYINPNASTKALLNVSIAGLIIYATALSAISCIFHAAGISLNYLVSIMACLLGGGALPMAFIVLWDRTSTFAAIVAPIVGLCSGLISWMVTTQVRSGTINILTTGDVYNSLTGDCVSLGMGLICIIAFSYLVPDKKMKVQTIEGQVVEGSQDEKIINEKEKTTVDTGIAIPTHGINPDTDIHISLESSTAKPLRHPFEEAPVPICALTPSQVKSQKRLALTALIVGTLIFMFIIPFSLYGTGYVFSKGFFYGYVVVAFIWAWTSFGICVLLPLWESWGELIYIGGAMWRDLKRGKVHQGE